MSKPGSLLYNLEAKAVRGLMPVLRRLGLFRVPRVVRIESTDICNANCITCTREIMTRPKGVMELDLYKSIVDECVKLGVKFIHLHNFGEPLIDKQIIEKIRYASEKGIYTRLFSNFSLVDMDTATALIESGLSSIKVSIDGDTPETFESIRRGLKFDEVVANINMLIEEKMRLRSKTPSIGLVFVETEKNTHELGSFLRRWKGKVNTIDISSYHNWGGSLNDGGDDKRFLPCLRLWQTFTILWNGDVSLCCMDYDGKVILGNVKDESLISIFRGEELEKIRQWHLKGEFSEMPICLRCGARR